MDKGIDTRLVYGFLDAGKTSFIQDCVCSDYFYRYGSTLILSFEEGEAAYDTAALEAKRARVYLHDGAEDVGQFCLRAIRECRPDRIWVEMNAMMGGLRQQLPECMRVTYACTWIDWTTLGSYFANLRTMLKEMVAASRQVTFRCCPSKEALAPYAQAFEVMNPKASYLRQDPMGYHEKAFDLFLPFSVADAEITVSSAHYLPLWLDALEHPEHYEGKKLRFTDPLELRRLPGREALSAGRTVMVCCMADLQFMGFDLLEGEVPVPEEGWITLSALARQGTAEYGRRVLKLSPLSVQSAPAPASGILSPA